jgi:hypothetical protein
LGATDSNPMFENPTPDFANSFNDTPQTQITLSSDIPKGFTPPCPDFLLGNQPALPIYEPSLGTEYESVDCSSLSFTAMSHSITTSTSTIPQDISSVESYNPSTEPQPVYANGLSRPLSKKLRKRKYPEELA